MLADIDSETVVPGVGCLEAELVGLGMEAGLQGQENGPVVAMEACKSREKTSCSLLAL